MRRFVAFRPPMTPAFSVSLDIHPNLIAFYRNHVSKEEKCHLNLNFHGSVLSLFV